jgi:N-acetylated-alpha-linked acidic dipeptidase
MADRPDETTPLITVVHVTHPPRRRIYRHNRVRRFCSCFLGLLLLFCLTASIVALVLVPECKDNRHNRKLCLPKHPFYRNHGQMRDGQTREWISSEGVVSVQDTPSKIGYDDLLAILGSTPNQTMARKWSQYYTAGPHLAGKNLTQANHTQDLWDEFGIPHTEIVPYEVFLNYPVAHSLTLLEQSTKKKTKGDWTVKFSASLLEDVLDEDDTSGLDDRIPTFHGYG